MSAQEMRQIVDTVNTELGVARLSVFSAMSRVTDNLAIVNNFNSFSPDAALVRQGLTKIENDLLQVIDELAIVRQDLDNFRRVL